MLVTKQLMVASDLHIMEKVQKKVNGCRQLTTSASEPQLSAHTNERVTCLGLESLLQTT